MYLLLLKFVKYVKMSLDLKLLDLFKYCYHFESSLFTYVMKKKSFKLK